MNKIHVVDHFTTEQTEYARDPKFVQERVDHYYRERVIKTWSGGHILKGRSPDENSLILSSNDYLAISSHPAIAKAKINSLMRDGNGVMMSSVFNHGPSAEHQFEQAMAKFTQAEDAVISQSGWCANTGLIQAIANEKTFVYIDMFAHTSLWEGIQSAGAKAVPFIHNNLEHLEGVIKKHGSGVIVIDSVYSTSGDVAPLFEMVAMAHQYDCVIVVDESHSLGTHGEHGEGMIASMGLSNKVHFRTASLAKAFAGRGGIILGSARNMEYFRYEARPAIFSSAVLPHDVAGFMATLKIIQTEDWRREKLHSNAYRLRKGLRELGYNVEESKSQIISLESGPEQQTIVLRDALESRGIFGAVFCAPATPKNRSLIRFSVHAELTLSQIEGVLKVCAEIRDEVKLSEWASTKRLARTSRRVTERRTIDRAA